ncbi:VCBS repeat-containing protein [Pyxidicoccus parkwayensis]|uniref:VCBS repeat-containing protein n=1 Tax=Pyxidicoccus parkwayensis TaxID=2813578 RepID=A0ABX7NJQ8_9BACT|nr:VCBS repeat-containing protein [Pyxidicoccus parkwaysis]QSQ19092.1 VCBS repeat-containing protein [Pyxidicoccus parkwaysis]
MKSRMLALCLTGLLGQAGCGDSENEAVGAEADLGESTRAIRGDIVSFNGDPYSDLIWREQATGNMGAWLMNGPVLGSTATLPAVSPSLMVQAASDFGSTTSPDLVYHSTTAGSGEAVRFLSSTFSVIGTFPISPLLPSSAWYVAASGDFNLDGKTDLVVHNRISGQYFYRYLNGTTSLGNSAIASRPLPWFIVGAADMNGDGRTDLVWRNRSTGQNEITLMNNTTVLGTFTLPVQPLTYYLGATADYTGDGNTDLVWHNPGTGQVLLWKMVGTSLTATSTLGNMTPGCPAWFSQTTPPPADYGCWYLVGPR